MELRDYSEDISKLMYNYKQNGLTTEISFRNIVKDFKANERATHSIHPYPAKLLVHIPHFFLNNEVLSKKGDTVLDPFCGSGTVLLESILSHRNSFGVDSNPLARLISKVKTSNLDSKLLSKTLENIERNYKIIDTNYIPDVVNINYWYSKDVQIKLASLLQIIKDLSNTHCIDFFLLCFSVCARKVSLADPRVSVPVRLKVDQYSENHPFRSKTESLIKELDSPNVIKKFVEIATNNIKRTKNSNFDNYNSHSQVIGVDARNITKSTDSETKLSSNSVDLVITSPPYAGAQKYIRASSLNLCWTELASANDLKTINERNIGRESYLAKEYKTFKPSGLYEADNILSDIYEKYPQRAHIASNYLYEMQESLKEVYRVIKNNGHLVLIAANNQICAQEFRTQTYLKEICLKAGFKVELELIDAIHSYGLMTKRNKTASIITREWVTIFKKE